jgi:hypothetical protein
MESVLLNQRIFGRDPQTVLIWRQAAALIGKSVMLAEEAQCAAPANP